MFDIGYSTRPVSGLRKLLGASAAAFALSAAIFAFPAAAEPPLPGAIFTTDSTCSGVDLNIYASKLDVYLNGGPAHPGAASLPDGWYWIQVTDPSGATLLGQSAGATIQVLNGAFAACYQLATVAPSFPSGVPPYDDTPNQGGEYKVWISTDGTFTNNSTKTDNFKVKPTVVGCTTGCPPPPQAILRIRKFYDANGNGSHDPLEPYIDSWKVHYEDGMAADGFTPVNAVVDPDTYKVFEYLPDPGTTWHRTTASPLTIVLANGDDKTAEFGNVCLGGNGGGLTLGFWSNKNGQALFGSDDLALMVSLNLRNANGTAFDPANYAAFRTWILSATATNMANMLSAQLAAMELNVLNHKVDGTAFIYAPGSLSGGALGFTTVNALMAEANTSLGTDGYTVASGATRTYQEALKNALDQGNNNLNFPQPNPALCPAFTFDTNTLAVDPAP
jgi:hypothetical protein